MCVEFVATTAAATTTCENGVWHPETQSCACLSGYVISPGSVFLSMLAIFKWFSCINRPKIITWSASTKLTTTTIIASTVSGRERIVIAILISSFQLGIKEKLTNFAFSPLSFCFFEILASAANSHICVRVNVITDKCDLQCAHGTCDNSNGHPHCVCHDNYTGKLTNHFLGKKRFFRRSLWDPFSSNRVPTRIFRRFVRNLRLGLQQRLLWLALWPCWMHLQRKSDSYSSF